MRPSMEGAETYVIRVEGPIDDHTADWFQDLRIEMETNDTGKVITTLTGKLVDQAALFGLLRNLYNLRLPLVSVKKSE